MPSIFTDFHRVRIIEWLRLEGSSRDHLVQPSKLSPNLEIYIPAFGIFYSYAATVILTNRTFTLSGEEQMQMDQL